ncbi:hypothetical protein ASPWEDRAFT_138846 [Aspergillus wentii DTO 134E9]|uniref:RNA polymerase II transcription factor SIII subunit A n=1 Tax=Aspergillus wentii DTO 134E9 TaxID=1073089 RepID=A0A1L9R9V8_ASPWE|nr:uncharacterized protein ASPWEDRAFT_162256 [Aspergillus wentii DTO 134E9]XP_040685392.1 uncharacterized protein ASPWEDRAFT_138846 [Aspergillus wentii DTO 134E9]KAI9927396.1 hypothetical protein MW887_003008 [Aspergillus wentii]OJJ30766.1 hypothetical protein ASPWEDRAFT_162256 [Aspergillus wentii DTO 134E9]OJJ31715.1 hypothetical protein ASPWEDRAFT_138846 [Aspergillus wentii DTO 134E9]
MPPPSLLQLSTATAIRNVKFLNDIGNIPYPLARPFLLKIESPEKLRLIEQLSPHISKDDDELWLEFIKRDIPRWDEYDLPEKSDCWYDVYCDLREQVQKAVEEDAEKLKMALDGISSERAEKSAKFVPDRRSLRLPQERPTAKQRYASYDRKMGGLAPVFSSANSGLSSTSSDPQGPSAWSFERPSLPRDTKKKSNIFTTKKRNNVLAIPTKQLHNRASQVRQAPRSLVEEHRRPSEPIAPRRTGPPPSVAPGRLIAPGRSRPQGSLNPASQNNQTISPSLQEREARLRALKSGNPVSSRASASSSAPKTATTSSPARDLSRASATGAKPKTQHQTPTRESSRPVGADTSSNDDESKTSPAQAPRPMVRKRLAPSVFMQPKKRKVT